MIATKTDNALTAFKGFDKHQQEASKRSPRFINDLRTQGLGVLKTLSFPTTANEEWKYTNIQPLAKRKYSFPQESVLLEKEMFDQYCQGDDIRVVFLNGIFSKELSLLENIPEGITLGALSQLPAEKTAVFEKAAKKFKTKEGELFSALNDAFHNEALGIHVQKNTVSKALIHIVHVTSLKDNDVITSPKTMIVLEQSSQAIVMESHVGFNDRSIYFANALTDILMEENAVLHYCKAQKESDQAFHIGTTRVIQERNSNLLSFSFMVGASITRNNLDIVLDGEGINSTLDGLYSILKSQHADNHTVVHHIHPNCTSNQLYKGILQDGSRSVFNGKIFVKKEAQLTNSYQLNKNLILGKDCRVDTKPQLEIFADDVKCTHGATIGQLNEDELFYLRSRAISKKNAVMLLSHGFVDDILNSIQNESIRAKLNFLLIPTFASLGE